MRPRIVVIGAGGWTFPLVLVRDIVSFPALQASEFVLHDIDLARAERTLAAVRELIGLGGLPAHAYVEPDRRAALAGADFVLCLFQVGGLDPYRIDVELPREFGIDQTVGDTLGPGGIFRGLRTIEVMRDVCAEMREFCPDALLIQYANPMAINCWATDRLGVKTVGLCHSVQHTTRQLADELGVPYEDVEYDCAGINHTAWITTFRAGREDLIPAISERMKTRESGDDDGAGRVDLVTRYERVRTELMRLTGYFHTESSHHASEYWAWFRRTPATAVEYIPERWDYFEICSAHAEDRNEQIVAEARERGLQPSEEYAARILNAIVTNTPDMIYGNVRNGGSIANLPSDACVELACIADGLGVRPIRYGDLPLVCAELNSVHIAVQRLAVEAALRRNRELVHAAVALDPLTSALLTLPQVRELVDRMLDAQAEWLPDFRLP